MTCTYASRENVQTVHIFSRRPRITRYIEGMDTAREMGSASLMKLDGVLEICEGYPVEAILDEHGRILIRAWNECGNNYTEIELSSLAVKLSEVMEGDDDRFAGAIRRATAALRAAR